MKPPVVMNARERRRTRASERRSAASPAAKPERERDPAGEAEDQEVRAVVLDVRVELLAEQQRDEPDERERAGEDTQRNGCLGPCFCA